MKELYFVATIITAIVLAIQILRKYFRNKPFSKHLKIFLVVLFTYFFLWTVSYFKSELKPISFGEDICFDDWCATVTSINKIDSFGNQKADGQFVILSIKMTNKARGIAQKPSEPRIHIIDETGKSYIASYSGQESFEALQGRQIPLDQRLELHQSLQTKIVFDLPKGAKGLKAVIEEGPEFITNILMQDDKKIFELK